MYFPTNFFFYLTRQSVIHPQFKCPRLSLLLLLSTPLHSSLILLFSTPLYSSLTLLLSPPLFTSLYSSPLLFNTPLYSSLLLHLSTPLHSSLVLLLSSTLFHSSLILLTPLYSSLLLLLSHSTRHTHHSYLCILAILAINKLLCSKYVTSDFHQSDVWSGKEEKRGRERESRRGRDVCNVWSGRALF